MKRSALKRGKPLRRKARLRAKGKSRFPKRRDPAYTDWVRTQPCLVNQRMVVDWRQGKFGDHLCYGPVQVCHVRSRGAGGDDRGNVVAMCWSAHEEQHRIGLRSFQARWGIGLKGEAERLYQQYQEETERTVS